jgi:hypothetical protein
MCTEIMQTSTRYSSALPRVRLRDQSTSAHLSNQLVNNYHPINTVDLSSYCFQPFIDRSGSNPVIHYSNSGSNGIQIQQCSALILAFPPTLSSLNAANLNVSADEQTVFGPIGTTAYFSSAVRLNTPADFVFDAESVAPNVPVDAAGEPVAFLHLFSTSNIATAWSWGPYRGSVTADQAKTLLKQTLSKVNKDPRDANAVPQPVTDADILGFQQNEYFPHFDSPQLAGGWYDRFNTLQGHKNTYYASGLNGFETVEFALRAGIDIVNSYFLT